jgi:diadenosine tetraphosphate (Ap4A) HIT family hydrolase
MQQDVICSPDIYYGDAFQKFINSERASANSRWIFDIIEDTYCKKREQIFLQSKHWCLCADQHHGHDPRYLVIFKDRNLATLRDLTQNHVALLREVNCKVKSWIRTKHKQAFHLFFHYMPSVFQLHLHVTSKAQFINVNRAHSLMEVIHRLQTNSYHYSHALLLTAACRTIKRAETHRCVQYAI